MNTKGFLLKPGSSSMTDLSCMSDVGVCLNSCLLSGAVTQQGLGGGSGTKLGYAKTYLCPKPMTPYYMIRKEYYERIQGSILSSTNNIDC